MFKSIIITIIATIIVIYGINLYLLSDYTPFSFIKLIGKQAYFSLPYIIKGTATVFGLIIFIVAFYIVDNRLTSNNLIKNALIQKDSILKKAENDANDLIADTITKCKLERQANTQKEWILAETEQELMQREEKYIREIRQFKDEQKLLKNAVRSCYLERYTKIAQSNPKGAIS